MCDVEELMSDGSSSPGLTVKETSKLGPRPEKPIEIYEFEGYALHQMLSKQ